MSEDSFEERIDATDLPEVLTPGHHAMAQAAFSWGDDSDELEVPQILAPGHHAMARAAFTWGDEEA